MPSHEKYVLSTFVNIWFQNLRCWNSKFVKIWFQNLRCWNSMKRLWNLNPLKFKLSLTQPKPVLSRILCKTVRTTVLKCLHKTLHKNVYIKPHTEEVWFHKENFSSPVFPLQVLKGCDRQRWLRNIIHVFPLAHEYLRVKVLTQFQKVVFFR